MLKPVFAISLCFISAAFNYCFAQQPKLVVPIGHTGEVKQAEYSPDGKFILTSSHDQSVKVWSAKTGELIYTLQGYQTEKATAQISPDSRMIATVSNKDNKCRIWEASSGKLLKTLPFDKAADRPPWEFEVKFSPNNKALLLSTNGDVFFLWDIKTGERIFKHLLRNGNGGEGPEGFTHTGSVFSTDGNRIIMYSILHSAEIWDATKGFRLFSPGNPIYFKNIAQFSKDGKYLITDFIDFRKKDIDKKVYTDEKEGLIVWDGHTGKKIKQLATGEIDAIQFSPDNKLLQLTTRGSVIILNTAKWDTVKTIDFTGSISKVEFSPVTGDHRLLILSGVNDLDIFDTESWEILLDQNSLTEDIPIDIHFSPDGTRIINSSNNNNAEIRDANIGSLVFTLTTKGKASFIHSVVVSLKDKWLLSVMYDGNINVWETATGKLFQTFKGYPDFSLDINSGWPMPDKNGAPLFTQFSKDEKFIITYQNADSATLWEIASGQLVCTFSIKGGQFSVLESKGIKLSDDHKEMMISTNYGNSLLRFQDYEFITINVFGDTDPWSTEDQLKKLGRWPLMKWKNVGIKNYSFLDCPEGSCMSVYCGEIYAAYSHLSNWIAIVSGDNIINIRNRTTAKELYSLFLLDSTEYLVRIPSGYYQGTTGAAKRLHYASGDFKTINFEQLDVKYNRPDKVLQAVGNRDKELIKTYRNAYYKRIKKLGIDTTAFRDGYSVPEADFVNRDSINTNQETENIILQIRGKDNRYQLDRFNVWVNEVPVYGQRGVNIRKNKTKTFDKTIPIQLSQGENRIETSVTNVNGTESYRMPLIVNYTPAVQQKETTYFIGIGIDKFADAQYNLQYSTKDIRDLIVKLKEKFGNNIIIDTLFNENVTVSNVKALKQKLQQTTVNDKVIISYSGHGLLSKTYDYYLSTYSVNFENPEEKGLAYDELENLLDSIPARKKLMLIDACHSGEVDKEEYQQLEIKKSSLDSNHVVSKGVILTSTEKAPNKLGLKNSFELMQNLFVNVGKSTGSTIISAAAGTEFALEKGDLKNGVFTYCVMEAMDKYPTMKISELKRKVGARVEELTNGMQKPTSRNEAIAVDWDVW